MKRWLIEDFRLDADGKPRPPVCRIVEASSWHGARSVALLGMEHGGMLGVEDLVMTPYVRCTPAPT